MENLKAFQLKCVNIASIAILTLLIYNFFGKYNIEHYFLSGASIIMVIHIWWGANFYVKYIGPSNKVIEIFLDISLIVLLLMSTFHIEHIMRWFIIFGTFFTLVIIKYLIGISKTKNSNIRRYATAKIKYEFLITLFFYLGAALIAILDFPWLPKVLSITIFLAQFPFVYYIFFKKKIYTLPL